MLGGEAQPHFCGEEGTRGAPRVFPGGLGKCPVWTTVLATCHLGPPPPTARPLETPGELLFLWLPSHPMVSPRRLSVPRVSLSLFSAEAPAPLAFPF